jgi:undecaprenyl-diphosphatase
VLRREPEGLRFARNLLVAFLPLGVLGSCSRTQIDVMLGTPAIVGWALIAGGIAILVIERAAKARPGTGVADLPLRQVIGIGLAQCLRWFPV